MAINHRFGICGCRGEDLRNVFPHIGNDATLIPVDEELFSKGRNEKTSKLFDKYFCKIPLDNRPWQSWDLVDKNFRRVPVVMPRNLVHDPQAVERYRLMAENKVDENINSRIETELEQSLSLSKSIGDNKTGDISVPEIEELPKDKISTEFDELEIDILKSFQDFPPLTQQSSDWKLQSR